jgi:hypothetical protein
MPERATYSGPAKRCRHCADHAVLFTLHFLKFLARQYFVVHVLVVVSDCFTTAEHLFGLVCLNTLVGGRVSEVPREGGTATGFGL